MMETAENRSCRDTMCAGNQVTAQSRGDDRCRIGNAGAQLRVWPSAVVVSHPFGQDSAEMPLVRRNQIVEALTTHCPDQSLAIGVGVSRQLHRRRAVRHKPFESPIRSIRSVVGRSS
jgi:hypothetical protein